MLDFKEFGTFDLMNVNIRLGLFILMILPGILSAQHTSVLQKKLSPALIITVDVAEPSKKKLYIITLQGNILPGEIDSVVFNPVRMGCYNDLCFYLITAGMQELHEKILPLPQVIFVEDGNRIAKEEQLIGTMDISANRINVVHNRFAQLNGNSITVSLKENKEISKKE